MHYKHSTVLVVSWFRLLVVIPQHGKCQKIIVHTHTELSPMKIQFWSILIESLFVSSRRGRSVSELCAPSNQSESPLLDAQRHSGTALAPVALAPITAAARPLLLAPYSSVSTAQMERASTETSCGFSGAPATQAVIHTAGPLALQSVSTMTPIPSGTESPWPSLIW